MRVLLLNLFCCVFLVKIGQLLEHIAVIQFLLVFVYWLNYYFLLQQYRTDQRFWTELRMAEGESSSDDFADIDELASITARELHYHWSLCETHEKGTESCLIYKSPETHPLCRQDCLRANHCFDWSVLLCRSSPASHGTGKVELSGLHP